MNHEVTDLRGSSPILVRRFIPEKKPSAFEFNLADLKKESYGYLANFKAYLQAISQDTQNQLSETTEKVIDDLMESIPGDWELSQEISQHSLSSSSNAEILLNVFQVFNNFHKQVSSSLKIVRQQVIELLNFENEKNGELKLTKAFLCNDRLKLETTKSTTVSPGSAPYGKQHR